MPKDVRIMAVDDEISVLESLKMILKIKDYQIDGFLSGHEAIDNFAKDKYDVIFLDMIIPSASNDHDKKSYNNGIDLLRKIKSIDPGVEVIIITAYPSETTHANAVTLGAMEYIKKPFLVEDIYEVVARALYKRSIRKNKEEEKQK